MKVALQMKHLRLSHSVARWSAPQLEQGYRFLEAGELGLDGGMAARTSCGSLGRLPLLLREDDGASW